METKILLHGGNSNKDGSKNQEFFQSIVNSVEDSDINILCAYFARPMSRWVDSFQEDKELFLKNSEGKNLELVIAKQEVFEEQIKEAQVIFLSGGMRGNLKEILKGMINLEGLFENKVIVGVSAGANILSTYYYSSFASEVREGVGYLPIKLFTHFNKDEAEGLNILKDYGEDLPVYTVPEEEFIFLQTK